jgi:hypothetical protein
MKKLVLLLISIFATFASPVSYAYFLSVNGTHYDVTWVTDSFNDIIEDNATAFSDNPWWQDFDLSYDFKVQWDVQGEGTVEFAIDQVDLTNYGDYCTETDCIITFLSNGTIDWDYGEYIVSENYADDDWTYAFATVVPEPGVYVLFTIGLFGLWGSVRRRHAI